MALTGCSSKELEELSNKYEEIISENIKIKQELIDNTNENTELDQLEK